MCSPLYKERKREQMSPERFISPFGPSLTDDCKLSSLQTTDTYFLQFEKLESLRLRFQLPLCLLRAHVMPLNHRTNPGVTSEGMRV